MNQALILTCLACLWFSGTKGLEEGEDYQMGTLGDLVQKMEDPEFLKDLPKDKLEQLQKLVGKLSKDEVPPDPEKMSDVNDPEEFVRNLKKNSDKKKSSDESANKRKSSDKTKKSGDTKKTVNKTKKADGTKKAKEKTNSGFERSNSKKETASQKKTKKTKDTGKEKKQTGKEKKQPGKKLPPRPNDEL